MFRAHSEYALRFSECAIDAHSDINKVLRRSASSLLDTNPLLACEEVDHIVETIRTMRDAMFVTPIEVGETKLTCDAELLRGILVNYMSAKACRVHDSCKRARAHNQRLGPNHWCPEAYKKGEDVDLNDFVFEIGMHVHVDEPDSLTEVVRSTYETFEEIEASSFVHCGNLEYIHQLVDMQLAQERKRGVLDLLQLLYRVGSDPADCIDASQLPSSSSS